VIRIVFENSFQTIEDFAKGPPAGVLRTSSLRRDSKRASPFSFCTLCLWSFFQGRLFADFSEIFIFYIIGGGVKQETEMLASICFRGEDRSDSGSLSLLFSLSGGDKGEKKWGKRGMISRKGLKSGFNRPIT
jgi:hypothetical protein